MLRYCAHSRSLVKIRLQDTSLAHFSKTLRSLCLILSWKAVVKSRNKFNNNLRQGLLFLYVYFLFSIFHSNRPKKHGKESRVLKKPIIFRAKDLIHTVGNKWDHKKALLKIWRESDKRAILFFQTKKRTQEMESTVWHRLAALPDLVGPVCCKGGCRFIRQHGCHSEWALPGNNCNLIFSQHHTWKWQVHTKGIRSKENKTRLIVSNPMTPLTKFIFFLGYRGESWTFPWGTPVSLSTKPTAPMTTVRAQPSKTPRSYIDHERNDVMRHARRDYAWQQSLSSEFSLVAACVD